MSSIVNQKSEMDAAPNGVTVAQNELVSFLLNVAVVRPVFIWGPPGIGKSSLVESFAEQIGLECVALLGSQLTPEDIIGIPQIVDGKYQFCPPRMIAKEKAYCLFLDEFNACSQEVQKAFYSLIHERRIGEYNMPEGSIIISAGNRAQDEAIFRPLSSALINRMVHVHLQISVQDWMDWAKDNGVHPSVTKYIEKHPDQLLSRPGKPEKPFSTPRAWHMLSDSIKEFGPKLSPSYVSILTSGCLSPDHAIEFVKFFEKESQ